MANGIQWLNMFLSNAAKGTLELVHQCKSLGWLINEAKSELVHKQQIVFLGEKLHFASMIAYPTAERRETVCTIIESAITEQQLQFGKAESLLGLDPPQGRLKRGLSQGPHRSRDRSPAFLHCSGSEKLRDSGVPSPQIEVRKKLPSKTKVSQLRS